MSTAVANLPSFAWGTPSKLECEPVDECSTEGIEDLLNLLLIGEYGESETDKNDDEWGEYGAIKRPTSDDGTSIQTSTDKEDASSSSSSEMKSVMRVQSNSSRNSMGTSTPNTSMSITSHSSRGSSVRLAAPPKILCTQVEQIQQKRVSANQRQRTPVQQSLTPVMWGRKTTTTSQPVVLTVRR